VAAAGRPLVDRGFTRKKSGKGVRGFRGLVLALVNVVEHGETRSMGQPADMVASVLRDRPHEWAGIGHASHHHTGENKGGRHVREG